jgi:hypothetical protein
MISGKGNNSKIYYQELKVFWPILVHLASSGGLGQGIRLDEDLSG